MNLPPGYEHTERAIEALRAAGAIIIDEDSGRIWCEERSTLKAMGVLRCRGGTLDEVRRRLAQLPRRVIVVGKDRARIWPLDELEAIPNEGVVLCTRQRRPYVWIEWGQIAGRLGVFSRHPAMEAWVDWLCGQFAPALLRHGYYNPATHHEPPPSKLLEAIERREEGRDVLNQVLPGLGDWFVTAEP